MQTETNQPVTAREYQDKVFSLLNKWARQRPGLEFCNYGNVSAYRSELRSITKTLADFNALMASAAWRTFTPAQIREAFRAYSGRLSLVEKDGQPVSIEYCTGQYWPTEYRKAACAVIASLLWDLKRDNMPPVTGYRAEAFASYSGGHGGNGFTKSYAFPSKDFPTRAAADNYICEMSGLGKGAVYELHCGLRPGDSIRAEFRREFGRGIAKRWFN